jgi:AcrR family transcriptional regulator
MASRNTDRDVGDHDFEPTVDGRRLRREQGRLAVVDATIDLVLAGYADLTVEQIADQAGVSVASVYRYFATLDELREAGIQRYFERYSDVMAISGIGEGTLAERIDSVVTARLGLYTSVEPVARFARRQAGRVQPIRETLRRVRLTLSDQLAQQFAPELDRMRPTARQERLAVITVLTAFESWAQMRELGIQPASIERAWRTHLTVLLDEHLLTI